MKTLSVIFFAVAISLFAKSAECATKGNGPAEPESEGIKPYSKNLWYWEYKGKPILLRGGTDNDNLYQWTGKKLTDHLDLLQSLGGNYVRNTMSDRDENNIFAHAKNSGGKYDITVWNEAYWARLEYFLEETNKRDIIVQLSLWDHFDLGSTRFAIHPLNPENNVNWEPGTIENSRDYYGGSLPTKNQKVLDYQLSYINKLLSYTLRYNHVLYNIENESSQDVEWEIYWAGYIKNKAAEQGREIHVTSMLFLASRSMRHAMSYPEIYSFAEISQNNQDSRGARGKAHYENVIFFRSMIEAGTKGPMPMNNEKIYGSGDGTKYSAGTGREAEDRFWKNVFAGCASVRFHRPEGNWGMGLSERAQANIRSMSMFLEAFDIFNAVPYAGIKMYNRSHEGYAMANIGKQYAVYLPGGRFSVELDPWLKVKKVKIRYLDIDSSTWSDEQMIDVKWEEGGLSREYGYETGIEITSPANRPCVAVLDVME